MTDPTAPPPATTTTPQPLRFAIDADCPACGWPERWYQPDAQTFGCRKCTHRSNTRGA